MTDTSFQLASNELRDVSPRQPRSTLLMISCGLMIAVQVGFAVLLWLQGHWLVGSSDGLVGFDFSCFWGAGKLVLEGKASSAYDWNTLHALLNHELAFDQIRDPPDLPFFYPPAFLLAVTPLALLSFPSALLVWTGTTLSAYLLAIRAVLPGTTAMIAALAAPIVLTVMWVGQNGLLTAALFCGALVLLDRRPLVSGILIASLAYKPHFGILIPLVLAATGRWRVFASAAATVIVLAGISGLLLGWDIFQFWIGAMISASHRHLVAGGTPWFKLQSIYGFLRAAGLRASVAWTVHIVVAVSASAATVWIWRSRATYPLKAATLVTAAMIVPPYMAIYDLPLLAVPVAFLVLDGLANGFRRWETPLLLILALVVMFDLILVFPRLHEPVGPIMCAASAAMIAVHLASGRVASMPDLELKSG
jgi:alpha-1,2-mannosyltransferase